MTSITRKRAIEMIAEEVDIVLGVDANGGFDDGCFSEEEREFLKAMEEAFWKLSKLYGKNTCRIIKL